VASEGSVELRRARQGPGRPGKAMRGLDGAWKVLGRRRDGLEAAASRSEGKKRKKEENETMARVRIRVLDALILCREIKP